MTEKLTYFTGGMLSERKTKISFAFLQREKHLFHKYWYKCLNWLHHSNSLLYTLTAVRLFSVSLFCSRSRSRSRSHFPVHSNKQANTQFRFSSHFATLWSWNRWKRNAKHEGIEEGIQVNGKQKRKTFSVYFTAFVCIQRAHYKK